MRKDFTNSEGKKTTGWFLARRMTILAPYFGHVSIPLKTNALSLRPRRSEEIYDISEIGYERRNGYSWYNNAGLKVLKKYEQWKKTDKD